MARRVQILFDNARANKAPYMMINGEHFSLESLIHSYSTADGDGPGHQMINAAGYFSGKQERSIVTYDVVTGELIIDGVSNFKNKEDLEEEQNEFGA
ncbi:MAG: hypothetical protein LBT06_10705 [Hungatella sp.]|jgi:hypothetical protein|nr:hypothetical protein [Hungatella sp.]